MWSRKQTRLVIREPPCIITCNASVSPTNLTLITFTYIYYNNIIDLHLSKHNKLVFRVHMWSLQVWGQRPSRSHLGSVIFWFKFWKYGQCVHLLCCISMGLVYNDSRQSITWPQLMWGQRPWQGVIWSHFHSRTTLFKFDHYCMFWVCFCFVFLKRQPRGSYCLLVSIL